MVLKEASLQKEEEKRAEEVIVNFEGTQRIEHHSYGSASSEQMEVHNHGSVGRFGANADLEILERSESSSKKLLRQLIPLHNKISLSDTLFRIYKQLSIDVKLLERWDLL